MSTCWVGKAVQSLLARKILVKLGICAHVLGVETEERTSEPCVIDVSVDCIDCVREVCCKFWLFITAVPSKAVQLLQE